MTDDQIKYKNEDLDRAVDIWKKVVDVQMHFNDLELRIRNYAILSLGGVMTVAGYALKEDVHASVGSHEVSYAAIILLVGVVIWLCFWFMDRHWYHRLLVGSVMHGIKIETMYKDKLPELMLSESIKNESPNKILFFKIRSHHRLNFFYWVVAGIIISCAMFLLNVLFGFFSIGVFFLLLVLIPLFTLETVSTSKP